MSDDGEKIAGFLTLKREIIDETIQDEKCTNTALTIFIITIILASIVNIATWYSRWTSNNQLTLLFGMATPIPTIFDIILEGVGQILFPLVGWYFVFYFGNKIGGIAQSKEHLMRAFGYSDILLIISNLAGFLNLIAALSLLSGLIQVVFSFWFIIVIIYATTIVFQKGALTAIAAFLIGGFFAVIVVLLPISILSFIF
ncbi:MAG: hypothetical protein EAX96_13305 [Candidatus Lokiarchaeota archaeon]|nr:hypothetical protein [Candidatus Lokiarchaeota archaeon]